MEPQPPAIELLRLAEALLLRLERDLAAGPSDATAPGRARLLREGSRLLAEGAGLLEHGGPFGTPVAAAADSAATGWARRLVAWVAEMQALQRPLPPQG